jgi:hypothetical protein
VRRTALALLGLGAAGCISAETPPQIAPMCESAVDCDGAAGEVCDEGVCWGDPPASATFAAVLIPPAERTDLAVAVVPLLAIGADGSIGGLAFPGAIRISGRVLLACPENDSARYPCGEQSSVAAQLVVERAAGFPGGPSLSRAVVATAEVAPGQEAFSFLLPRNPDAEYRITILPDESVGGEGIAPGEIAPPRQIVVTAGEDQVVDWVLGEPAELKAMRGCVQNVVGAGAPYAAMKVVAYGRWTKLSPLERASSRSVTGPEGCFELSVPRDMLDEFDIQVSPAAGAILPSLTLRREFVRDPPEGAAGEEAVHVIQPALIMPIAPAPTTFQLPIQATGSAGGQEPVIGASVRLTTVFTPPSLNEDRAVEIRFEAQALTETGPDDDAGVATVQLYPGDENNRRYEVSVVPPAGSQFQAAFGREIDVGIGGAEVLEALTLERRTAVTGLVLSLDDEPVADAPIEALPSSLFRQGIDRPDDAAEVAALPAATSTTDATGAFLLWLDRELVGQTASYDIDVIPATYSGAPGWSFEDVEIPGSGEPLDLGTRNLPGASFARAVVRDQSGSPVPGAEVDLYQLPSPDYCANQTKVDPAECEPPAKLRGVWRTDEDGVVRVVLPDP